MIEKTYLDNSLWAAKVIKTFNSQLGCNQVVVSDIDDTILDSNLRWYHEYLVCLSKSESGIDEKDLPSVEEFRQKGPRYFFSQLVTNYNELKNDLMSDTAFNSNLLGVATLDFLRRINSHSVVPHGYVTTRSHQLSAVTLENIQLLLLPLSPILFRAETIRYEDTVEFKSNAIQALRTEMDKQGLLEISICYIDDYAELIDELNALGLANTLGIVFFPGATWENILAQIGIN